jgi:Flp pilus assembly protein TadD
VARRNLAVLAVDTAGAEASAIAALEKSKAERPDDAGVLYHLASIYFAQGAMDKALATFQSTLQASPDNVPATIGLAQVLARRHETTKALELAKRARQLAPDDPVVAHTLGRLAYATDDYQWSASLLQEAAAKLPTDPEVLFDLAQSSYAIGRVAQAEAAVRQALAGTTLFVRAGEARTFLEMLSLAARPDQGPAEAEKIAQVIASNPTCLPALAAQAGLLANATDPIAGIKAYEKILSQFPDFAPAQRQLVLLYSKNKVGNPRALELAFKARLAFPDDPKLTRAVGLVAYRAGDFGRASEALRESTRQDPKDAEATFYLGAAQFGLKQRPLARESLRRAVTLDLPADLAVEAKRMLAELE